MPLVTSSQASLCIWTFVALLVTVTLPSSSAQELLSSNAYLDKIRTSSSPRQRAGSVDVMSVEEDGVEKTIGLCHLPFFNGFSIPPGISAPYRIPFNQFRSHQAFVAAMLAAEHLNNGDGRIIPEVEGLNKKCNVRFTVESFDTSWSENLAVNYAIETMSRPSPPCMYVGAGSSSSSIALSVVTSGRKIPVFSGLSQSTALDSKEQHPYFGRVSMHEKAHIVVTVRFFKEVLGVKFLAVVHTNNDYGISVARALHDTISDIAPEMLDFLRVVGVESDPGSAAYQDSVENAARFLKQTGYKYFLAAVGDREGILEEGFQQGIAGTGHHNWMFTSFAGIQAENTEYEKDSPLYLAMRGVTTMYAGGALVKLGNEKYLGLIQEFEKLKSSTKDQDYIKTKLPQYGDAPDFFDVKDPSFYNIQYGVNGSGLEVWTYDTVILAGLAACNISGNHFFDGPSHYNAMLETEFFGSSGLIRLDKETGSREVATGLYGFMNNQEKPLEGTNETVLYEQKNTYIFLNNKFVSTGIPHIFNDGGTEIPPDLFSVDLDMNYIGTPLRIIGLVMSGIIIFLSLTFFSWTTMRRNERVVRASQPVFLGLICLGTLLLGASIIPLSLDDEVVSEEAKSSACMAVPWLGVLGFGVAFSALFAKTWRINKIFNSPKCRRVKVTERDVMAPLLVVSAVNIIILSLWTALSPLKWQRETIVFNAFNQPIESVGSCWVEGGSGQLAYFIPIIVLNLGILVLAAIQAYQTRHIHLEFAESEYIALALAVSVIVCFVAIPVMVIVNDDPAAYFFALSCILFVLSGSLLANIFIPKMRYYYKAKANHGNATKFAIQKSLPNTEQINTGFDRGMPLYEVEEETSPEVAQELIKRDERLAKTLHQLERHVSTRILALTREESTENDNSSEMLIVDSPNIRESLQQENIMLKKSLDDMQRQIQLLRSKIEFGLSNRKSSLRNLPTYSDHSVSVLSSKSEEKGGNGVSGTSLEGPSKSVTLERKKDKKKKKEKGENGFSGTSLEGPSESVTLERKKDKKKKEKGKKKDP